MRVTVARIECKRCGHAWAPRIADPVRCPKCQSPRFQEPVETKGGRNGKRR